MINKLKQFGCVPRTKERKIWLREVRLLSNLTLESKYKCRILVLVNVFDKQITAAENVCPQRREVIINGNGDCFHRAIALGRDETSDDKHEEISK